MKIDSICGTVVDYRGFQGEECIIMKDGYITAFTEEPRGVSLDYRGTRSIIIPGLIDLHVHLRGLELRYKEDEYTGTLNAIKSGITLVVDMPNTKPYLNTREAILAKLSALQEGSHTDYGIYAGIPPSSTELGRVAELPVAGFKAYPRDLPRREILREILSKGALLIVHSEDPVSDHIVEAEDLKSRGEVRPCYIETLGLEHLEGLEGRIHVTHVSCPQTMREAEKQGYTIDTTPHHILLDDSAVNNCLYKVNPPLRDPQTRLALLQRVAEGKVNALASDHAPHASWEKSDPLACKPGIIWLPGWPWIVYRALVAPGYISVTDFLWLTSRGPAEILGLWNYGSVEAGARANLVVVDLDQRYRYLGSPPTRGRKPVYHWMAEAQGYPVAVIVGGEIVYEVSRGIVTRGRVWNPFSKSALR